MVFHWRLSDSKSLEVSRTLLSILAVFNNTVVWMVSTRLPTFKSSRPFNNPLVTVPKAPITISIIVTFMFHSFFNSLARSRYLSLFSHSFSFILWSAGTAKSTILQIFFFFLIIIRSGLRAEIKWSVCISKSHRSSCVSFPRTGSGLCIYHLLAFTPALTGDLSLYSDRKSPQISRTLLSILANLNNTVVRMVSVLPLISICSNLLFKPLGIVLSTPTAIGVTVTLI